MKCTTSPEDHANMATLQKGQRSMVRALNVELFIKENKEVKSEKWYRYQRPITLMYGKLFESMYDGTLVEDWRALITFQQMVILCDADGVLDMTADAISRRTGIPLEYIDAGIEILEQIDKNSRTPDSEGRRIIRMDEHRTWGWHIVNHTKYKQLVDADTIREQNRIRKQRQREKGKVSQDVTPMSQDVTQCHAMSRHTYTDIYTNTDLKDQDQKSNVRQKPPDPPPEENNSKKQYKFKFKEHSKFVLEYFNEITGRNFDPVDCNLQMIDSCLRDAVKIYHSVDDATLLCRRVILDRKRHWESEDDMREYLRPKTIFAKSNFWNYAGGLPENMQISKPKQEEIHG